jgi:hypothetical protein
MAKCCGAAIMADSLPVILNHAIATREIVLAELKQGFGILVRA